jgi:hypothetical protein
LTSVTIPNSVTSIGDRAFEYCSDDLTIYGDVGSYAETYAKKNSIPFDVLSSSDDDFIIDENGVLTGYTGAGGNVVISNSVTSISDYAFQNCSSLTSVIISDGVTSIGDNAFYRCSSLTSVTILNSITSIGDDAFYRCANDLTIYGYSGSYAETYANENNIPFGVPGSSPSVLYGDADKDGSVGTPDLLRMRRFIAGDSLSEGLFDEEAANVYYDGNIDLMDVLTLRRHILQWYKSLPITP